MFQSIMRGSSASSQVNNLAQVNKSALVIVPVLAVFLAGCNTSGSSSGASGGSLFSSNATTSVSGAATAGAPAASSGAVVQAVCPKISLRDGTSFYRTYAKSGSKDPQDVVFQASLAETTRACTQSDTTLTVKVQVAGRLVAGPQGHAGSINMPIRVAVVDGDTVVSSELVPFTANLASADQPAQFLFSRDITMAANATAATQIFVGFDEGPAKTTGKPSGKKRK